MSNTFAEIIIIGSTLVGIGLVHILHLICRPKNKFVSWRGPKKLSPYKEKIRNTSILFLEKVVNQRKTAIARLVASELITWEEYYGLYEAIMMWKENKLKSIEAGTFLFM